MSNQSDQLLLTRAMASLVEELNPGKLDELRKRFPDSADLFNAQYVLGATSGSADPLAKSGQARTPAIRALIEETLLVLGPAIDRVQTGLVQRIQKGRRLRLVGSLVATVCSAGAVATLTASHPALAPVASSTALAGALAMLLGEHFEKPVVGGGKSLSELLGSVIAAEPQVHDIRLRLLTEEAAQAAPLMEIARKLHEIAANVKYASLYGAVPLRAGAMGGH